LSGLRLDIGGGKMKNILLKKSFLLKSKTYSTGLIFSILFFINLPYLKSFDFDLMPINIHFYGAVTVGSNIIVYGSNGAYLMTTDKGRTWKQYSLHSNGKIYHMVSESGWVWAIIDKGIVAFSSDGGFNWYKKYVPLDSDE